MLPSLQFPLQDDPEADILSIMESAHQFIDLAKASGKCCLVHCSFGMSRSPTVVIAYLMRASECSLAEALKKVKAARPVTAPNTGFMRQLVRMEQELRGTATVDIERYKVDRTADPKSYVINKDTDVTAARK